MRSVRELLAAGRFHESTVEEVAEHAGVSRATLYQHFRSRVDLVDAICDTFAENPALVELRWTVELPDADRALAETIAQSVRFWASEDAVLRELYGVVAIDPAAAALVERQRADRRGEIQRLARNLRMSESLPPGMGEARAVDLLMVLTSYDTFRELHVAGRPEELIRSDLVEAGRTLLLA
jgi:AcrR family transcriptional regulator